MAQLNLFDNELQVLITINTRTDDQWVNATRWCEHFDKTWYEFARSKETKSFLKALKTMQRTNGKSPFVKSINKGRAGSETWVHPLVAIKLAEWLSSERGH